MRRRGRVDANHLAIVKALRQAGCSVQSLADIGSGCPDLLVGLRGQNFLLEIKDWAQKPSKRKLTGKEVLWLENWRGQADVITTPEQALRAVGMLT